jgi:radical SAM protein with 4Fe4S-binding SPASM domain
VRWKELLDELFHLHCQSLFITGGDLTIESERTREVLEYAASRFGAIFITGHREHFSLEFLESLEGLAYPIIQTESLAQIDPRYSYLLVTEHERVQDLPPDRPGTVALDLVSQRFDPLQPGSPLSSRKKIQMTSLERFTHSNKFHPCLANSIAVTWKGDVLPCPMMRQHSLGNIRDRKLWTFLKGTPGSVQEFWAITQGKIDRCGSCEFRYSCTDCRALEIALTGSLYGKVLCNYDPAQGTWRSPAA